MHLETYNQKKEHLKRKNHKTKLFVFLAFIFVISSIILSVQPELLNFTGKSINQDKTIYMNSPINTSISIPLLTLKNTFPEIIINFEKESSIIIDGKKFTLKEESNKIILKDFEGTIIFDENKINILSGKASKIILNSNEIISENKKIEISLNQETIYNLIHIPTNIHIKNLNYITSGEIKINQDIIKLEREELFLNNYNGTIKAENKKLNLEGKINSIEIIGQNRKIKITEN